jgi:hypothetical protein
MTTKWVRNKRRKERPADKQARIGEAITRQLNAFYSREKDVMDPVLYRLQVQSLLKSTAGDEW